MSDNKHYYYLKLKENFFDRPEIKAIESQENGYEYICIIQKMYLRSLQRDGQLMLTDSIPYDLPTLSHVLGHKQETIAAAVGLFKKFNLCEVLNDKTIYMTEIQAFIGQSSTEAERKREYRARIENKRLLKHGGHLSGHVSDERAPELKIENKVKSEDTEKERNSRFVPPSVQEISAHLQEKQINDIDPESFWAFYESKGWVIGRSPMKSWKAAVTTWVKRAAKDERKVKSKPQSVLEAVQKHFAGEGK